jgi:alginate O-acetyltransferase complex protein AlgJ
VSDEAHTNPLPAHWRRLPGVFILGTLLLGFGAALLTPATWQWPREGSFRRGEQTAAYEAAFNQALPFREGGITTWGILEYIIFREGREGVVVGEGDWLFSDEEIAFYPDAEAETARKLRFIERVDDELSAQGVELIVALVPDKVRVYSEHLGRPLPSYTRDRYDTFRRALLAQDLHAPDLLLPLLEAKASQAVFLRTDTHWTPAGAAVVAHALAESLPREALPGLFAVPYETEVTGRQQHEGDLLNFLPLGPLQERLGPPPDTLEVRQTRALGPEAEGAGGLFGEVSVPVALVGTSYSANSDWHFAEALEGALGAAVLNLATEGRGPLPPMRDYLESRELQDTPPVVVVWEIPERYLPAPETTP